MVKRILTVTGGLVLLALLAGVGLYLYILIALSQDAQPDESSLDKAAINQPHFFDVAGAGTVRLTVSADWVADGWGHVWRYTTQIDYSKTKTAPWIRIGTQTSKRVPLIYSDQHAIGEQILITNLRSYQKTHLAHGFKEFYLWSENSGVKKYSLRLHNPRTLTFYPRKDNKRWQEYSVDTRPEASEHEVAVWKELVKEMNREEICWYAFSAGALKYTYKPEQAILEVMHEVGKLRLLTFKFVTEGSPPELLAIETLGPEGGNRSPQEMGQLFEPGTRSMQYVEPSVLSDLQIQQHPCAEYYQKHNLIRPDTVPGPGFLYPAH